MTKRRILIIENSIHVTGGLKAILRTCIALKEHFHFEFIVPRGVVVANVIRDRGFRVTEFNLVEIRRSIKALISYTPMLLINAFKLRYFLKINKIDLIVSNDFYNLLAPTYRFLGGIVPYVTFVRFMPDRFPKTLVNLWCLLHFRYSYRLIAVSNSVKEKLERHQKVVVVYSEIPLENEMKVYPYNEHSREILYLSNYMQGKGQEYALIALASLGPDYEEWKLRFRGSDMGLEKNKSYKRRLQKLALELGIQGRIHWGDFATDVAQEYRQAGLVLNLSESESFSLTCVEAMYCNRPVLATACGGPTEIITHGVDGELVQLGSQQEINIALSKLLRDSNLRRSYADNASKSVAKQFGLQQTTYKLIPIFEMAIKGSD